MVECAAVTGESTRLSEGDRASRLNVCFIVIESIPTRVTEIFVACELVK